MHFGLFNNRQTAVKFIQTPAGLQFRLQSGGKKKKGGETLKFKEFTLGVYLS